MAGLLEVEGFRKSFGGLVAVDQVSLSAEPGEIHSIIGPNGAGKTTLFSLISGIEKADAGHVYFEGRDITKYSPPKRARLGIGRTFQHVRLFAHLTVVENLLVAIERRTSGFAAILNRRKNLKEARELLDAAGLLDKQHEKPQKLSYGQQKRVELARAMALKPRLLLLDEPAAGLSLSAVEEMRTQITLARDDGVAVLLIEHNMSVVMDISDRVTVLNLGKKLVEGRPEDVRDDPNALAAYLGRNVDPPVNIDETAS